MQRTIGAEKIVEAADHLMKRVQARFPESGLARVAQEIRDVARETDDRCRIISRPTLSRQSVFMAPIALALAVAVVQVSESAIGGVAFLGAAMALVVTLETRRKRGQAAIAINELRSLAYIIDSHQLTRDPQVVLAGVPTAALPARRMAPLELNRFLDDCSEMLALLSGIAEMYVKSCRFRGAGWRGRDLELHLAAAGELLPTPHRS